MKRAHVYIAALLLSLVLPISDYVIQKDLENNTVDERKLSSDNITTSLDNIKAADVSLTNLTIENFQNDDNELTYSYDITVSDVVGAYKYKVGDKEGYLVFTAIGESTFNIKSNEKITIYDLPVSSTYKIEQLTTSENLYTLTVNDNKTNTYSNILSTNNNITFNNETVIKETESLDNEVKEETKKENPITIDNIFIVMISLVIVSIITILAKKLIKVKRFE